MEIPYRIVIEPQEYEAYAKYIDHAKILVLPFQNLGLGSIPARNWIWEHSIEEGHSKHWILDDNIDGYIYYNNNLKNPIDNGAAFAGIEAFVDRYSNVALAGHHYSMFICAKKGYHPPFLLNTRIYSSILIDNSIPFRWRGKYNEDTDLSLRVLKSGLCTMLFYVWGANKMSTMMMKGGNEEIYSEAGKSRHLMTESLIQQHPDCVRSIPRYGREVHHYINYRQFYKNKLIRKNCHESQ